MSESASSFSTISGDSAAIVAGAYIFVLLPWTFLYAHDFISNRWLTIAETWKNGIVHIVIIFLPVPYLIYYGYLQLNLRPPDYKELCMAITALLLSFYHLVRTTWGLIQLHHFREWVTDIAIIMEIASYQCFLPSKPRVEETPKHQGNEEEEDVAFLNVNSPQMHIIDTYNCVGHVKEKLLSFLSRFFRNVSGFSYNTRHSHDSRLSKERVHKIMEIIDDVTVNDTLIDNEFASSTTPPLKWPLRFHREWFPIRLELRSKRPTTTFVRWAVTYLSHFGRSWLQDIQDIELQDTQSFETEDEDIWKRRRQRFSVDLLTTISLRMGEQSITGARKWNAEVSDMIHSRSFFEPTIWSQLPLNDQGLFSRDAVLEKSFSTGSGMPYGGEVSVADVKELLSASEFKPLIKEAAEALDPGLYNTVEGLTPEQIEWFLAFIWTYRNSKWRKPFDHQMNDQKKEDDRSNLLIEEISDRRRMLSDKENIIEKKDKKPPITHWKEITEVDSRGPIRLLREQLGMDVSIAPNFKRFVLNIHREAFGQLFWDNRSILAISARIDNWLALRSGRHVQFCLKKNQKICSRIDKAHKQIDLSTYSADSMKSGKKSLKRMSAKTFRNHEELEQRQLRYQLANPELRGSHTEHGVTFLGCIYESVRSKLAEHLYRFPRALETNWITEVRERPVTIGISDDLWTCLVRNIGEEDEFGSAIQERLLWECQMKIYSRMSPNDRSLKESLEPMLLLVMGFPSVAVRPLQDDEILGSTLGWKNFAIEPIAGPQNLAIYVQVYVTTPIVILRLQRRNTRISPKARPPIYFHWRAWRDAHDGRLSGKWKWQDNHHLQPVEIKTTREGFDKPIEPVENGEGTLFCKKWSGWEPFRAGMAKFELQYIVMTVGRGGTTRERSFVRETLSKMAELQRNGEPINDREIKLASVHSIVSRVYEEVKMAVLGDAMLQLDTALKFETTDSSSQEPKRAPGRGERSTNPNRSRDFLPGAFFNPRALRRTHGHFKPRQDDTEQFSFVEDNQPIQDKTKAFPKAFTSRSDLDKESASVDDTGQLFRAENEQELKKSSDSLSALGQPGKRTGSLSPPRQSGREFPSFSSPKRLLRRSGSFSHERTRISQVPNPEGFLAYLGLFSQRQTQEASDDDGTGDDDFEDPLSIEKRVKQKVEELDPEAMCKIADWYWTGKQGEKDFPKQPEMAVRFLERALFLSRRANVAQKLVMRLTDWSEYRNREERDVNIDRALFAVNLLWDNVERMTTKKTQNGLGTLGRANSMDDRISQITELHEHLIRERKTSKMMRKLADRLSVLGTSKEHRIIAIRLYESALIISSDLSTDVKAMVNLAVLCASDDRSYSEELLHKARQKFKEINEEEKKEEGTDGKRIRAIIEELLYSSLIRDESESISEEDWAKCNIVEKAVQITISKMSKSGRRENAEKLLPFLESWDEVNKEHLWRTI